MVKTKKKKINMTIPEWLWVDLMERSKNEFMPMATYSRRLLIDAVQKNNNETDKVKEHEIQ